MNILTLALALATVNLPSSAVSTPTQATLLPPVLRQSTSNQNTDSELAGLRKELQEIDKLRHQAEIKAQILEVRQDIQESAYSRLEILLGAFGFLITILVIIFGIRTEKAAARAAQGEVADRKKELDEIIAQARLASVGATRAAAAAEIASVSAASHAKTAATHAELAREGADAARASTVNAADSSASPDLETIERAAKKTSNERGPEEFRVLILSEVEKTNWEKVINLAREMQVKAVQTNTDYVFSLFQEAFAFGELDKYEIEIGLYSKLIDQFIDSEEVTIKIDIAASLLNRGIARQIKASNYTTIEDFDELIERYSNDKDPEIVEIVATAYMQRAKAHAELNNVNDTISELRAWSALTGEFDCGKVVQSVFFTPLLNDNKFRKFVIGMGCKLDRE